MLIHTTIVNAFLLSILYTSVCLISFTKRKISKCKPTPTVLCTVYGLIQSTPSPTHALTSYNYTNIVDFALLMDFRPRSHEIRRCRFSLPNIFGILLFMTCLILVIREWFVYFLQLLCTIQFISGTCWHPYTILLSLGFKCFIPWCPICNNTTKYFRFATSTKLFNNFSMKTAREKMSKVSRPVDTEKMCTKLPAISQSFKSVFY